MPEAIMKGIYDEASSYDNMVEEKQGILDVFYYYYKLKKISKKIKWSLYVEKSKDVCNGAVVLKGTRIRPETILEFFLNESKTCDNADQIMLKIKKNYPTLEDETILMAFLYTIRKKGIKVFL